MRPFFVALMFSALATGGAVGCSPVVGGACVTGALVCEGRCVDPRTDEANCGACGVVCDDGLSCFDGRCARQPLDGAVDAGVPDADPMRSDAPDGGSPHDDAATDAGDDSDAGADGGVVDAGPIDAGPDAALDGGVDAGADAGPVTCDLGTEPCGGVCADVRSDVRHCGACGVACDRGQYCDDGTCVDICGPGTTACGTACVDLSSDADHCGTCFRACPTGLCDAGMCTGALAGHLVVIGHSFEVNRAAMDRVLGNAVLLSAARPVRVLPFEGAALSASLVGARRAIDDTASTMGRAVVWHAPSDEPRLSADLADADVLLVHAQVGGTDADLDRLGATWSLALGTFLARGGVVVVLDTMATHRGTFGIVVAAGLASVDRREDATAASVRIVAPGDGVAIGVPLTYRAERTSVRFFGADMAAVAADAIGPIVLHRTVVP